MSKTVSLYCIPTRTFALIELPTSYGDTAPAMLGGGEIEQRAAGDCWRFAGSDAQVCGGFSTRGWTLIGDGAPQADADHVYRTERGFDAACRRLAGQTVAEHQADWKDVMAFGMAFGGIAAEA